MRVGKFENFFWLLNEPTNQRWKSKFAFLMCETTRSESKSENRFLIAQKTTDYHSSHSLLGTNDNHRISGWQKMRQKKSRTSRLTSQSSNNWSDSFCCKFVSQFLSNRSYLNLFWNVSVIESIEASQQQNKKKSKVKRIAYEEGKVKKSEIQFRLLFFTSLSQLLVVEDFMSRIAFAVSDKEIAAKKAAHKNFSRSIFFTLFLLSCLLFASSRARFTKFFLRPVVRNDGRLRELLCGFVCWICKTHFSQMKAKLECFFFVIIVKVSHAEIEELWKKFTFHDCNFALISFFLLLLPFFLFSSCLLEFSFLSIIFLLLHFIENMSTEGDEE